MGNDVRTESGPREAWSLPEFDHFTESHCTKSSEKKPRETAEATLRLSFTDTAFDQTYHHPYSCQGSPELSTEQCTRATQPLNGQYNFGKSTLILISRETLLSDCITSNT